MIEHSGTNVPRSRAPLLLVAIVSTIVLLPELFRPLSFDNNLNHAMGWLLEGFGRLPAVGSWDQKFPTINYIHAGIIALLGVSALAFHLFDLLCNVLLAVLLAWVIFRYSGSRRSVISGVVYALLYMYAGVWMTGQRDVYASLFMLGAVTACLNGINSQEKKSLSFQFSSMLASGLLTSFALSLRPTLGFMALSIAAAILIYERRNRWSMLLSFGVGNIVAWLLILLPYFLHQGALAECYTAVIRYNTDVYASAYRRPLATMLMRPQEIACDVVLLFWLVTKWPTGFQWRKPRVEHFLFAALYIAARISIVVMGKYYIQHYHSLIVFSSVLIATMLSQKVELPKVRALLFGTLAIALAALYVLPLAGIADPIANKQRRAADIEDRLDSQLADYLSRKKIQGKSIEVWGNSPGIYWRTETCSSSRFTTLQPLMMRGPSGLPTSYQRQWQSEFLDSLSHNPPVLLVIAKDTRKFQDFIKASPEVLVDSIPGFRRWIESNYTLDTITPNWIIYDRRIGSR